LSKSIKDRTGKTIKIKDIKWGSQGYLICLVWSL
jgi:hypothetical protein